MAVKIWRIQCDPAGQTDPVIIVFLGAEEADDDGVISIRQDTRWPVRVKFSELTSLQDLLDAPQMLRRQLHAKTAARVVLAASMAPVAET